MVLKKNTAIIKKLVAVAIVLVVVTISVIAFIGVYTKNLNTMSDIIPSYTYSTEFEGNREYKFVLANTEEEKEVYIDSQGNVCGEVISAESDSNSNESTEVEVTTNDENATVEENDETNIEGFTKEKRIIKANEDSVLTKEAYKESRKIIEERLEKLGTSQYNTRLDEVTGDLIVEIPDDEDANFLYEAISSKGKFEIIDSQTGLKLMDNSNLKIAAVGYNSTNSGYTVYLQLQFNKEGAEILKDMSNKYIETTIEAPKNETTENANDENANDENATTETTTEETETPKTETKYIEIKMDDTTLTKTYFGEELSGGYIQIPVSQNITDADTLNNSMKSANAIAILLNSGNMPNEYVLESDDFLQSTIDNDIFDYIKLAIIIVLAIISLILIIKFGVNGIIGAILNIGYLATVSLAMRYTGVIITISSLITMIGVIAINFGFMYIFLSFIKKGSKAKYAYLEAMKKFYLSIIPIGIVAFVFTFMQNASVIGIGMILFWGLIVQALYSVIFTRNVYVLNEK